MAQTQGDSMTTRRDSLKQRLVWLVEQVDGISLRERDACYRAIERVDDCQWVGKLARWSCGPFVATDERRIVFRV